MINTSILSISVLRSRSDGVKITPCTELNGGLPIPSLKIWWGWILPSTFTSIAWSGRRWGMSSSMSCAVAERERQKLRRRNYMNRPSQRPSLASSVQFLTPILLVAMVLRLHLLHRLNTTAHPYPKSLNANYSMFLLRLPFLSFGKDIKPRPHVNRWEMPASKINHFPFFCSFEKNYDVSWVPIFIKIISLIYKCKVKTYFHLKRPTSSDTRPYIQALASFTFHFFQSFMDTFFSYFDISTNFCGYVYKSLT